MSIFGQPSAPIAERDDSLSRWLASGGDARITPDPLTGQNRYFSTTFPRDIVAFASSTANDLTFEAEDHLHQRFADGPALLGGDDAYAALLDSLRDELRRAYGLAAGTDVFFAPSGTDLEYVGLLAVAGQRAGGIRNVLLGAQEVGSGCIESAAGRYFAGETALGLRVPAGAPVAGLPPVACIDLPVRDAAGEPRGSDELAEAIAQAARQALDEDAVPLVHIVHGSKTGLILPELEAIDGLRARFGSDLAFVVDACQARIAPDAVRAYLDRGMIVFLTGSKFVGGPPFSGFALLPPGLAQAAAPIARGMANVFRRAEIPAGWPGRGRCAPGGNPGLALRLAAAIFELRRFLALPETDVRRAIAGFAAACDGLATALDLRRMRCVPGGDGTLAEAHPLEMRTLVTLDLNRDAAGRPRRDLDFAAAQAIHRALLDDGIRLGQPVRCSPTAQGCRNATLRIGLSMPQIVRLSGLGEAAIAESFAGPFARIAQALEQRLAPHPCRSEPV